MMDKEHAKAKKGDAKEEHGKSNEEVEENGDEQINDILGVQTFGALFGNTSTKPLFVPLA